VENHCATGPAAPGALSALPRRLFSRIYFVVCPLLEPLGLVVLPEAPELLEPLLEGLVLLPEAPVLLPDAPELEEGVCELVLPLAPLDLK
jgi:hypothetical protein